MQALQEQSWLLSAFVITLTSVSGFIYIAITSGCITEWRCNQSGLSDKGDILFRFNF